MLYTRALNGMRAGLNLSKLKGVGQNFENFNIVKTSRDGMGTGLDCGSDGQEKGINAVPCRALLYTFMIVLNCPNVK